MQPPSPACPASAPTLSNGLGDGLSDGPVLVFDGGCVFCRHFAELSELRGGLRGLRIHDGRADPALLRQLEHSGARMRDGAFLIAEGRVLHGADAIAWLCAHMTPSDALLQLLATLLASPPRARRLYPLLLAARRLALAARGLSPDPTAHASASTNASAQQR